MTKGPDKAKCNIVLAHGFCRRPANLRNFAEHIRLHNEEIICHCNPLCVPRGKIDSETTPTIYIGHSAGASWLAKDVGGSDSACLGFWFFDPVCKNDMLKESLPLIAKMGVPVRIIFGKDSAMNEWGKTRRWIWEQFQENRHFALSYYPNLSHFDIEYGSPGLIPHLLLSPPREEGFCRLLGLYMNWSQYNGS